MRAFRPGRSFCDHPAPGILRTEDSDQSLLLRSLPVFTVLSRTLGYALGLLRSGGRLLCLGFCLPAQLSANLFAVCLLYPACRSRLNAHPGQYADHICSIFAKFLSKFMYSHLSHSLPPLLIYIFHSESLPDGSGKPRIQDRQRRAVPAAYTASEILLIRNTDNRNFIPFTHVTKFLFCIIRSISGDKYQRRLTGLYRLFGGKRSGSRPA